MTLVCFLNFLAEFKKCIIDKRAGSMVKWKASWIMNQQAWAGILRQVTSRLWTFTSFSKVTKVFVASSTIWRVMRNTKPLASHGTLCVLPWGTLDHLPFHWTSCPGICHLHEFRRLQRWDYILVTENQTMAAVSPLVGTHEQRDFFQLKVFLPYTFLKLWCLV